MTRNDIIYVVNYAVSDEEKKLQRISYTSLKKKKEKKRKPNIASLISQMIYRCNVYSLVYYK